MKPMPITRGRLITELVHVLALGVWLGCLGVAGLSAGQIFRTMRGLDPALPAYEGFDGAHWAITAGHAVQPMFLIVDAVQFVCLLLAGGTFALATGVLGLSARRVSTFARVLVLLGLVAILSYRFFALQPGMMQSLAAYWQAAAAGETETALRFKEVFDRAHVVDRRLMMATLVLVLGAIGTAFWSIFDRSPERGTEMTPTRNELQEPALAGRR